MPAPGSAADDSHKSAYYPTLDGVRGLAALMVVYGHAGYFHWVPLLSGCATLGVLLFFFLSGFLMGHHYPAASSGVLDRRTLTYWASFLLRRFTRVYPPYVFAPIVGYLILMPRMPPDFDYATPLADLSIAHELYKIAAFKGELGIYWTIEVELFFYLLYPLIIVLCLFCRNRVWTLLLVFVALTLVRQLPHAWLGGVIPLSRQWAGFTSMFVAGVLAAIVARKSPGLLDNRLLHRNALTLISFLVLFVIVAFVARSNLPQDSVWKLQWLLSPLFFVMFISLVRSDGIASRLLASRVGITLGHVSFSLYLVHIIAYNIVTAYLGERYQGILAAVVVLFVMTSAYYVVFERPFVRLSKRITVSDKFGWPLRSAAEVSRPKPSA